MDTRTQEDARLEPAFQVLRAGIAQRAFPGAAAAVTLGGKLLACRGVGRFTYEPDSPEVTAENIFDLASLTKVLATTTMAMVLYERGELDLDAPVAGVLPEFAAEDARRRDVSARMLLAHTSGLPAYVRLFEHASSRDELLLAACRTPLQAAPGERTVYSDIGFIVLGELLRRVADEGLDTFCQREIFGPLGMARTGFRPQLALKTSIPPTENDTSFRHRVIQGEVHDENASVMGGVAGHAGLFAPAGDVARFAECMLRGGAPILRRETITVFLAPQPSQTGTNTRGLGWDFPSQPSQSGRYFTRTSYGHLGFTGTSLWVDRERGLSVTLLSNRTWPERASQEIKRVRPAFHDAVVEALGLRYA